MAPTAAVRYLQAADQFGKRAATGREGANQAWREGSDDRETFGGYEGDEAWLSYHTDSGAISSLLTILLKRFKMRVS
jgi:hypothetical protein